MTSYSNLRLKVSQRFVWMYLEGVFCFNSLFQNKSLQNQEYWIGQATMTNDVRLQLWTKFSWKAFGCGWKYFIWVCWDVISSVIWGNHLTESRALYNKKFWIGRAIMGKRRHTSTINLALPKEFRMQLEVFKINLV